MVSRSKPHLSYNSDYTWTNFHQSVRFKPQRYYDVWNFWDDNTKSGRSWEPGLSALQQIVRTAEKANCQVRAAGGGWSLSNAVETSGYLLNTLPLNLIEIGVRTEHCAAGFLARGEKGEAVARRLVFAQCGTNIAELNRTLESNGLSLPTSGASNGQTICGAMSTGTHGAAHQVGAIQDYVVGLHVIAEGGRSYWIQRRSQPVVNESFCAVLGAELKEDDDVFYAAAVAFGTFGIIHAVLLEAEPLFLLERHVEPRSLNDVFPILAHWGEFGRIGLQETPFHFEVLVNPYVSSDKPKSAYVRYMYKRLPHLDGDFRHPIRGTSTLSNDAFSLIGTLSAVPLLASAVIPSIVTSQLEGLLDSDNETLLTHGGTFDATKIPGHSVSTEMGFALADVPAALDIILKEVRRRSFPGIPALRFVKASPALLAFTMFEAVTCTIEVLGVHTR